MLDVVQYVVLSKHNRPKNWSIIPKRCVPPPPPPPKSKMTHNVQINNANTKMIDNVLT
jgi:hypothetical protein